MSFGRDMRFARWKLQGEYNITATNGSNITFAKQKYHAELSEAYNQKTHEFKSIRKALYRVKKYRYEKAGYALIYLQRCDII